MIVEKKITTLKEFAEFVAEKAGEKKPYWYRGVRDANHGLTPSLYRHPTAKSSTELRDLENEIMLSFKQRALPFQSVIPADPMDLLFLMQHHGVPTRLLDWSENPFVGLFFALEQALLEDSTSSRDSAVWMVDPVGLNKASLDNHEGNDRILAADDDLLNAYKPGLLQKSSGRYPVAIFGVHNSRRIVAQRGVFVLFGANNIAMQNEATLTNPEIMHKLIIEKDNKRPIIEALFNMGVTDSVIYPDLDGLGREIRNRSGFWRAS